MSKKKPDLWMPLFIGDYLADTMGLTTEQHGAYLLLLIGLWKGGGRLDNDESVLAATTRLPLPAWRKHAAKLLRYFLVSDDGLTLTQKRLTEEYEQATAFQQKQEANGKKGGRPKKTQPITQSETQTEPNANPNESPSPSPSQKLVGKPSINTPTPASPAGAAEPEPDRIGTFEGHEPPERPPTPNPVAAFAIALNEAGHRCTAMNPALIAYVDEGGTVEHLRDCIRLPDARGKPAAYVVGIARREITEKAKAIESGGTHERNAAQPSKILGAIGKLESLKSGRR